MELYRANKQWATRPRDERFETLDDILRVTKEYAETAREKTLPYSDFRVETTEDDVQLVGKANQPAKFTFWSFGQLASRVSAPAGYLRTLPPKLVAENLNYGLTHRLEDGPTDAKLLFHTNGGLMLRAFTSDEYSRVWNWEVAERLLPYQEFGWEPARPDTNTTVGGVVIPGVSDRGEAALYASDHDMFAFLRNRSVMIREGNKGETLQRGVIVENSEVGASALRLTRFLYRVMCGNHIIWGASKVEEISLRHVGKIRERMQEWEMVLRRYAEESASDDEAKIERAMRVRISDTKEDVLDKLFGIRSLGLGKKMLEASYEAVRPDEDGDPRTAWGFAQGITRHSQTVPYADQRTQLDRAAGKLLEIEF